MGTYFKQQDGRLLLGNEGMELVFSGRTGSWLAWRKRPHGHVCLSEPDSTPPLRLVVGGHTVFRTGRNHRDAFLAGSQTVEVWQLAHADFEPLERGGRLALTLVSGPWRATTLYELSAEEALVRRNLQVTYNGEGKALLWSIDVIVPAIAMGPAAVCRLEAPGQPILPHMPVDQIPQRPVDAPRWRSVPDGAPGVIGIHNPATRQALIIWLHSETEPARLSLVRGGDTVAITHRLAVADRFGPGHAIDWGSQYLRWIDGTWRQALADFQHWYAGAGWLVPADRPEWVRDLRAYELHVGTKRFARGEPHAPFGRLRDITAKLPSIRDLGFNTIQLMPRMPYPSYTVHDYRDVDTHYGDRAELVELVQRAHCLGMKAILDVVLHGVFDKTAVNPNGFWWEWGRWLLPHAVDHHPYLDAHPEWFMRDEYDQLAMTYTYAFNYGHRGWQQFVVDALKAYVAELDVDGFRIDAPTWNGFPNWDPRWTKEHRASAMRLAAIELFALAQRELKALKPECILYCEGVGPLWVRASDCLYNYDEQWLLGSLVPVISPRGFFASGTAEPKQSRSRYSARQLAEWLEERRLAYPPGTLTIHHLDSHDTHEWGQLGQFRKEAFGIPAARALFALCAWIEGGIQSYVGAEEGSEDFYRMVLHWRDRLPALARGTCDYTAIASSHDTVFAPLRRLGDQRVVPLIHLDDTITQVMLSLPATALGLPSSRRIRVHDVIGDRSWELSCEESTDSAKLTLELAPYDVRLLVVAPAEGIRERARACSGPSPTLRTPPGRRPGVRGRGYDDRASSRSTGYRAPEPESDHAQSPEPAGSGRSECPCGDQVDCALA